MQEPIEPPDAVRVSDTNLVRVVNEEPRDVVALLHSLDQNLFAAHLAAEAVRIQSVGPPAEAEANLRFLLVQLDAAADTLRSFLLHAPPA